MRSKGLPEDLKDIEQMLDFQGFPYISNYLLRADQQIPHDLFAGHFGIEKFWKLIARKYYWLTLPKDVETYIKGYNVCLASKAVCHKLYGDLQSLFVPTHW